tara:strand:+ start:18749 stop:19096 length:348 start_codon:yes stop_codon:yes gene_type:complete
MSKRFKDFDAAQDAKNPEPIKIKVNETEYEFPPFLSASVVLEQLTWIGEDGAVAASNLPRWFVTVFGKENYTKISQDVDFQKLQEISQWLMEQYGLTDTNQELAGGVEDEGDTPK